MPQFAANLTMMYTELPFLDRFEAAAQDGFKAVEYLFPYAFEASDLSARLKAHGLQQVLFNAPPGGTDAPSIDAAWGSNTRGIASIPGREAEFQAGVQLALRYAEVLHCPRIHLMAGLLGEGQSRTSNLPTYVNNLRWAAIEADKAGLDVLITPSAPGEAPAGLEWTGDPAFNFIWTSLHVPCVTVPAGTGPNGLPLGIQIVGRRGEDRAVLAWARWVQAALG